MVRRLSVRARWAVPAGTLATVGIVIAAAAVASASVPSLPHRTAAQLLADVGQASGKSLGPLTATVQQTADLGLPQLPQIGQSSATSNLTAGTQSITIWYRDPRHIRVAEPVQDGESDLRLNGRTLWLWSSKTQTATRVALPAHFSGLPGPGGTGLAPRASWKASSGGAPSSLPETPLAVANQVLKAVGPATVVGVQSNVYVAGRAAYQLALVPRTSQSLVGKVLIAIDASRSIPLRVEVFGRGSAGLAYSIGFTALSFGTPAASNFSFTPPPGATVKSQTVPSSVKALLGPAGLGPAATAIGSAGAFGSGQLPTGKVVPGGAIPKRAIAAINAQFAKSLPASMTKAQRAAAIKKFDARIVAVKAGKSASGGGIIEFWRAGRPHTRKLAIRGRLRTVLTPALAGAPQVIGKDWLSVVAIPANPQVAAAVHALLSVHGPGSGHARQSPFGSSSSSQSTSVQSSSATSGSATSVFGTSAVSVGVPFGPNLAVLRTLLLATTPVHGSWGSGRLLQTKLLSVLITSKGQILAGAVTPAVLFADVAADAG
jgi:hypothetical protein